MDRIPVADVGIDIRGNMVRRIHVIGRAILGKLELP